MSAEPEPPTGAGFKYWAFLSYSHQDNLETRKDGERGRIQWAEWLHDALENYRVPPEFRGRNLFIFRNLRRRPDFLVALARDNPNTGSLPVTGEEHP